MFLLFRTIQWGIEPKLQGYKSKLSLDLPQQESFDTINGDIVKRNWPRYYWSADEQEETHLKPSGSALLEQKNPSTLINSKNCWKMWILLQLFILCRLWALTLNTVQHFNATGIAISPFQGPRFKLRLKTIPSLSRKAYYWHALCCTIICYQLTTINYAE